MAQSFVCYKLTGHTADKATEVWYFGYVRVLARQTLQQAVDWRKGKHLRALKWCLRDVNPGTVEAVPLGHRLPELQSMKMEAASMVRSRMENSPCACESSWRAFCLVRVGKGARG